MDLTVAEIFRYPVKSCRGERLAAGAVEPWGLAGDRRWMVVDDDGCPITPRDRPSLILVTPRPDGDTAIRCTAPGMPDLTVKVPLDGELVPVEVGGSELLATLAD